MGESVGHKATGPLAVSAARAGWDRASRDVWCWPPQCSGLRAAAWRRVIGAQCCTAVLVAVVNFTSLSAERAVDPPVHRRPRPLRPLGGRARPCSPGILRPEATSWPPALQLPAGPHFVRAVVGSAAWLRFGQWLCPPRRSHCAPRRSLATLNTPGVCLFSRIISARPRNSLPSGRRQTAYSASSSLFPTRR